MKLTIQEAKDQFINEWGNLSINWGVSRSLGQVHGYLLVQRKAVTYDDIRADLKISQGNANAMIRMLLDWGLIRREAVAGERKEYFVAEKDVWKVAKIIARERRRRELDPIISGLAGLKTITGPKAEVAEFSKLVGDIQSAADAASKSIALFERSGLIGLIKLLS